MIIYTKPSIFLLRAETTTASIASASQKASLAARHSFITYTFIHTHFFSRKTRTRSFSSSPCSSPCAPHSAAHASHTFWRSAPSNT